jgi:hypothetical protein
MRVYKFLSSEYALQDMRRRRVKISEIHDLNDPFELIPCDLSDSDNRRAVLKTRDELSGNRGLLCFALAWANPVLWAHYSDKHRGICLGFDVRDDLATPITYVVTRIPWRKPDVEFVQQILFTKFAGWEYEGEVRVYATRDEEENGLYFADFNESLTLRKVIVGHRCCIERGEVLAALTSYPEPVDICKARLSYTSFEVIEDVAGFAS